MGSRLSLAVEFSLSSSTVVISCSASSVAFAPPHPDICCLCQAVAGILGFETPLDELEFLTDLGMGILEQVGYSGCSCNFQSRN